jgi:MoaA/NifB/PqqE/SkfB family radical SAM enzyme
MNAIDAMNIKARKNLDVTVGLQMVFDPKDWDQVVPMAKLGRELGVDYTVIKHCSDNEDGFLGVKYEDYPKYYDILKEAESYSTDSYQCTVKWSKIKALGKRRYSKCYGPPLHLQISGTGLIAPCGMLFNERYKDFHVGNFTKERFKDMLHSDRYWEVMDKLHSDEFDPRKDCGSLCLQHKTNELLWDYKQGKIDLTRPEGPEPKHVNFI